MSSVPWCSIPDHKVISVEHPCIVKSVDNAIKTLGGEHQIEKLVDPRQGGETIPLSLRPEDPLSKSIHSKAAQTNNVLVKITVPKRTGRKRKRGSAEPYGSASGGSQPDQSSQDKSHEVSHNLDVPPAERSSPGYVLRSLRDNVGSYRVEAVGPINHTHRFRGLSDYQQLSSQEPFVKKMQDTIMTLELDRIKKFKLDPSKGVKPGAELFPPPHLSSLPLPFNYSYLQNPAVKFSVDASGQSVLANSQMPQKLFTQMVTHDAMALPTAPSLELPPTEVLDPRVQSLITRIHDLLEQRPLWTRRALSNKLGSSEVTSLKFAYQYVGYMFRSGPWREAVVKFGVDPRSDPSYRVYQTLMFQISTKDDGNDGKSAEEKVKYARKNPGQSRHHADSHIFDGRIVSLDGKVWQVCDITDPLLHDLLATDDLRETCDTRSDGWFPPSTWSKVKVIMKDKISRLLANNMPSDLDYQGVLESGGADTNAIQGQSRRGKTQTMTQSPKRETRANGRPRQTRSGGGMIDPTGERVTKALLDLEAQQEHGGEDFNTDVRLARSGSEDSEADDLNEDEEIDEDKNDDGQDVDRAAQHRGTEIKGKSTVKRIVTGEDDNSDESEYQESAESE